MAKQINRLSSLDVRNKKDKGLYPDGGNLYMQVTATGSKSWLFRYMLDGKARQMGLGSTQAISLSDARNKAEECRRLLNENIDPIENRKKQRMDAALESTLSKTFKECAEEYIESHKAGWKNKKHAQQWSNTLRDYVYPVFGDLSVQNIDTSFVLKSLKPIWYDKTETARRVRSRIEIVIDWAIAMNYRQGENPALWRGRLDKLLPKPSSVKQETNYDALPYNIISDFIPLLARRDDLSARALEFTILTATRTNEALGAKFEEFNLDQGVWVIPKERMKKGKREHRVPLSEPVLKIVNNLQNQNVSDYLFYGLNPSKPISNMAMLELIKRMREQGELEGYPHFTVHGFRSSFRDWGSETTNFSNEVLEMALAHTIKNKAEAAYRRGDLFEKRSRLMEAWASYCCKPNTDESSVVVNFQKGA
jgi:integrase